ncbi:MAG: hypothetical protein ACR2G0_09030 [Chthoniobacterales bacterium]
MAKVLAVTIALATFGYSTPHGQAAAGDLFVTDLASNSVIVYSPDGTQRTFATDLDTPEGIVFDSLGNLYVADHGSGNIYKYKADGSRTVFVSGLQGPVGLNFATSSKQLLVSEHDADQVTSFSLDGVEVSAKPLAGPVNSAVRNLTNDRNLDSLNTAWFVSNSSPATSFVQEEISGGPTNTFLTGLDLRDITFASYPQGSAYDTAFVSSGSGTIYGISTMDDGMGGLTNTEFTFQTGLGDLHGLVLRPSVFSPDGMGELFAADTAGGKTFTVTAQPSAVVTTFATGGQPNYMAFETILPAKLQNISTRGQVLTGDNVLIVGFIVAGAEGSTRQVVIRGIGPSLSNTTPPLAGALADPILELYKPDGTVVTNDSWMDNSSADQMVITDRGLDQFSGQQISDAEPVLVQTLEPGLYTAILRGVNDTTGIGMVEVYDLDSTMLSDLNVPVELANISTRGTVGQGDDVLIAGFFIGPSDAGRVLIRAIGPELSVSGVSGVLSDPTLELHDQNGTLIASNDNWADTAEGEISASGLSPTDTSEAAILTNLPANSLPYTAIVGSKDGSSGVALVEVYHLP